MFIPRSISVLENSKSLYVNVRTKTEYKIPIVPEARPSNEQMALVGVVKNRQYIGRANEKVA